MTVYRYTMTTTDEREASITIYAVNDESARDTLYDLIGSNFRAVILDVEPTGFATIDDAVESDYHGMIEGTK